MNQEQIALVDLKLKNMLRKGAIQITQPVLGDFPSNLSLVRKKDGDYCLVINLNISNRFVSFSISKRKAFPS